MDAYRIHDMLEDVSEAASTELAKGTDQINTKEFGEVVDMIKDLTEAEKNKMEACYYKSIIQAMEDSEYGEDYDWEGRMGYSRGSGRGGNRGGRRGYNQPMMYDDRYDEMMDGRMGYSNGAYGGGQRGMSRSGYSNQGGNQRGSRYGFSHDEYMSNQKSHSAKTPEDMKVRADMIEDRMDDLYDMFKEEVKDMTPEEKQLWKTKLNRIVNM